MPRIHRLPVIMALLSVCVLTSCGGGSDERAVESTAVVFSDIHFNPFYDPSLFPALEAADVNEWEAIFQTSSSTTPAGWGSDTNYPLLARSLTSIRQNVQDSPIAIFTGDLLGHYFPQTFFKLYGSEDVAAMQAFADKTLAFVMAQVRSSVGEIPVLFAVGNGDSYTGYGPDPTFLSNTAELYYANFLNGAADHAAFLESFTRGGYYAAEPLGMPLMVIALNTVWLSPLFPGDNQSAVDAQRAWLEAKLAEAKAGGKKVWLVMHVPPGADLGSTANLIDGSGGLESAVMMWDPQYQDALLRTLARYQDMVTLTFAGHTHMDEYRLVSGSVCHISPGLSPVFGTNPAYKIFSFSPETTAALDYTAFRYDLAAMPEQFEAEYDFAAAYAMPTPLDAASQQLFPELAADSTKQASYRAYYYSWVTPANPITAANWPVYWCGIGHMEPQALIECVNAYGSTPLYEERR